MSAKPKLQTESLKPENVDENTVINGELVGAENTQGPGLAVLERLPDPEAREWLGRVKRVVEEALTRQSRRLAEREDLIREQSETIARFNLELRHHEEIAGKERELFSETNRRVKATNKNMRSALEERDRRLVVFARKLSRLRQDKEGKSNARLEIVQQLQSLKWHHVKERRALLSALEVIS